MSKRLQIHIVLLCCLLLVSCKKGKNNPTQPENNLTGTQRNSNPVDSCNVITGTITDYLTDSVLVSVYVFTRPATDTTISDSTGLYFLRNIPEGNYSLIAVKSGYNEMSTSIVVRKNDTLRVRIFLGGGLQANPPSIHGSNPLYIGSANISGGSGKYSILSNTSNALALLNGSSLIVSASGGGVFGTVVVKDDFSPPYSVKVPVSFF